MPAPPLRVLPPPVDLASTLERLHPVVTAWCRRLGGPGVDAQDAAQEVIIITARRAAELHDLGALEPWAFAVTRNVLRRHRRRQWWRRWVGAVDEGLPAPGAGPEDHVGDRRLAGLVDRVLDRLPLEQREVLVLCLAEGRSDSEVAALTGWMREPPDALARALPEALQADLQRGGRRARRLLEGLLALARDTTVLADVAAFPGVSDDELRALSCPVLAVYGTRSACWPEAARLRRVLPAAQVVQLEGGHYLPVEATGELGAVLRRWLHA